MRLKLPFPGGGVETAKLSVTAGKINDAVNRYAQASHETNIPFWYRVCRFIPSYAVAGRLTIRFAWNYNREGIFSALFKAGWDSPKLIVQFPDFRVNKIRIVRSEIYPYANAYMDVLISNINNKEIFQINTELLSSEQATAYAGDIDSNVQEGYVVDEYDIT